MVPASVGIGIYTLNPMIANIYTGAGLNLLRMRFLTEQMKG